MKCFILIFYNIYYHCCFPFPSSSFLLSVLQYIYNTFMWTEDNDKVTLAPNVIKRPTTATFIRYHGGRHTGPQRNNLSEKIERKSEQVLLIFRK